MLDATAANSEARRPSGIRRLKVRRRFPTTSSSRRLTSSVMMLDTISAPTMRPLRVPPNGDTKCRRHLVFLSETLVREAVALQPLGHDLYQLHFAALTLGVLDARMGTISRPAKAPRAGP